MARVGFPVCKRTKRGALCIHLLARFCSSSVIVFFKTWYPVACCCCFSSSLQRCDNVDATACLDLYGMVTYLLGVFIGLSCRLLFQKQLQGWKFLLENEPSWPSLTPPPVKRQGSSSREERSYCEKSWKCFFYVLLQFLRNEADLQGRSSRSPVTLFDIQDNNNVNSFAVSQFIRLTLLNTNVLLRLTSLNGLASQTVKHPFAFSLLPLNQRHLIWATCQVCLSLCESSSLSESGT